MTIVASMPASRRLERIASQLTADPEKAREQASERRENRREEVLDTLTRKLQKRVRFRFAKAIGKTLTAGDRIKFAGRLRAEILQRLTGGAVAETVTVAGRTFKISNPRLSSALVAQIGRRVAQRLRANPSRSLSGIRELMGVA